MRLRSSNRFAVIATSSLTCSRLRCTQAADWRKPTNLSSGVTAATVGNARSLSQEAWAPGSTTLDDVIEQLQDQEKLTAEIFAELKAQNLKAEEVICVGSRFGGQWRNLGGARAVPYECEIGKKKLAIEGTVHIYDAS